METTEVIKDGLFKFTIGTAGYSFDLIEAHLAQVRIEEADKKRREAGDERQYVWLEEWREWLGTQGIHPPIRLGQLDDLYHKVNEAHLKKNRQQSESLMKLLKLPSSTESMPENGAVGTELVS